MVPGVREPVGSETCVQVHAARAEGAVWPWAESLSGLLAPPPATAQPSQGQGLLPPMTFLTRVRISFGPFPELSPSFQNPSRPLQTLFPEAMPTDFPGDLHFARPGPRRPRILLKTIQVQPRDILSLTLGPSGVLQVQDGVEEARPALPRSGSTFPRGPRSAQGTGHMALEAPASPGSFFFLKSLATGGD